MHTAVGSVQTPLVEHVAVTDPEERKNDALQAMLQDAPDAKLLVHVPARALAGREKSVVQL